MPIERMQIVPVVAAERALRMVRRPDLAEEPDSQLAWPAAVVAAAGPRTRHWDRH